MDKQTMDELMNTMYIKEIVEEANKENSEDNVVSVFLHLMLRVKEEGLAPMAFQNPISFLLGLDPDMELEDVFEGIGDTEERFVVLEDNGFKWIPLFTDRTEMADLEQTNKVREVPIRDILEEAAYKDGIVGIVINPFTDGFAIFKPILESMLEEIDKLNDLEVG